jgi:hypothetical protein
MTSIADQTDSPAPAGARVAARSLLWPSLGIALGSRLALFALVYLSAPYTHRRHVGASLLYPAAQVYTGSLGRLLNPWAHWDGVWYIRIASHGYAPFKDSQAFFPLYPDVVRAAAALMGHAYELTGILVSVACFVLLCVVLHKLVAREFGERIALASIAFLCVFPTSFYFQAVYTESLFVLLAVLCFFFARRPYWPLAGLAGALATLTHISGVVLLLPMTLLYARERRWRIASVRADVASLLLVPAGLVPWMVYLQSSFGNALLFRRVQAHWGRTFAWPWTTVGRGVMAVYYDVRGLPQYPVLLHHSERAGALYAAAHLIDPAPSDALTISNSLALGALVLAVVVIALGWRRLPLAYSAFAVGIVALPLFGPTFLRPLLSMPRFILAAFPLFIAFALLTDGRPVRRGIVLALFAAGLVLLTLRFAAFRWVA